MGYIFFLLMALLVMSSCADSTEKVPRRLDNVRNLRYCTIVAFKEQSLKEEGYVYSSAGLSQCSADQLASLDVNDVKKQLDVSTVSLGGPYYITADTIMLDPQFKQSPIMHFDGIVMQLRSKIEPYTWDTKKEYYKPDMLKRSAVYVYKANTMVYQLVAPNGDTYAMISYSQAVNSKLSMSDLPTLDRQLTLPLGWRYEVRRLQEALVIKTDDNSQVIYDNLENIYQRVNQTMAAGNI